MQMSSPHAKRDMPSEDIIAAAARDALQSRLCSPKYEKRSSFEDDEEQSLFEHYYCKNRGDSSPKREVRLPHELIAVTPEKRTAKRHLISKFYTDCNVNPDSLQGKFREAVRAAWLERMHAQSPTTDDLNKLCRLLDQQCTSFDSAGRKLLWFSEYRAVGRQCCANLRQWLTPTLFGTLMHGDERGRILTNNLLE